MAEYIEKAELIKKLCFETAEWHYSPTIKTIMEFPAADVQPARFARWIDLDNRILCSGCGAGYDDSDEVKQNTYIFCPNCGARMDGDTNV